MFTRLSHTSVFVKDQNEALRFYTETLGFEIRTDATADGYRWLTVGLKDQPDLELVLMALKPTGFLDAEDIRTLTQLQEGGKLGGGVLKTDDIHKTYKELTAKGVEFLMPPTEQSYAIEAVFKDNSGNWFSLTQER
jgi:catechol 2,3-dioxygenase-like lactoylglutathione lyase family enzyme